MNKEIQNDSKTVLVAEDEQDLPDSLNFVLTLAGFGWIPTEYG